MRKQLVCCGGSDSRGSQTSPLRLDVGARFGIPGRINLRIDRLSRRLAEDIPELLTDLLEVAAYIYAADQLVARGSAQMNGMGAEWRRSFRLKIPVRCQEVWRRPQICEALRDTLTFLSEDEFEFEFLPSNGSTGMQRYFSFDDPEAQCIVPDEVMLFSGGLDSLAGTVSALTGSKSVALVSHQSSTMIAAKQSRLVNCLRASTTQNPFFVPVTLSKGQDEAVEFTQRTRSFMFATLAFIVARVFGLNSLSFYENGIVSVNLPIAEHVLGARASRTTHPMFLAKCSRLFSLLLDADFAVVNPFLWKTKTDVVQVLVDNGRADLIGKTFSCARVRESPAG